MCVSKEAALCVGIRQLELGMEINTLITQRHTPISFKTCRIAKELVLQWDVVREVLDAIRWHSVIGIVDKCCVSLPIEAPCDTL